MTTNQKVLRKKIKHAHQLGISLALSQCFLFSLLLINISKKGYRLEVHAIGDRAAEEVFNAFRSAGISPSDRAILTQYFSLLLFSLSLFPSLALYKMCKFLSYALLYTLLLGVFFLWNLNL